MFNLFAKRIHEAMSIQEILAHAESLEFSDWERIRLEAQLELRVGTRRHDEARPSAPWQDLGSTAGLRGHHDHDVVQVL